MRDPESRDIPDRREYSKAIARGQLFEKEDSEICTDEACSTYEEAYWDSINDGRMHDYA